MGILKQGIFGGFSGRVANVIGSSWKGIAVVKSRPLSVAYPGTADQVAQTDKMTGIVAFAKSILSQIIKPLWDRFASRMSGYNAFVSRNMECFVGGNFGNPQDLVIAQGSMVAVPIVSVSEGAADHVVFTWGDNSGVDPLAFSTDVAYLLVVDHLGNYLGSSSTALRAEETGTVICPTGSIAAQQFHCYLAFRAYNGTRVSNTSYKLLTIV